MKKFVFLMLTCSSFMAAACAEDPESVGGPVTDGNSSEKPSGRSGNRLSGGLSSNSSNGASINSDCWGPVTTTGFAYFSITRLVVGISYVLGNIGGGGGGNFGQADNEDGCHNITGEYRHDVATASFVAAYALAATQGASRQFCKKYKPGSTYTHEFPNGDTVDFSVFSCTSFRPLFAEVSGSCG